MSPPSPPSPADIQSQINDARLRIIEEIVKQMATAITALTAQVAALTALTQLIDSEVKQLVAALPPPVTGISVVPGAPTKRP
jgi:hypothetical protein